jgi:hypothetical protein
VIGNGHAGFGRGDAGKGPKAPRQHPYLTARPPRIGATLQNRQLGQPDHILQISYRAQQRLHRVHQSMRARGKHGNVVVVAAARELACFLWAAATAD